MTARARWRRVRMRGTEAAVRAKFLENGEIPACRRCPAPCRHAGGAAQKAESGIAAMLPLLCRAPRRCRRAVVANVIPG